MLQKNSWARRCHLGHLRKCQVDFLFFNQRPHTSTCLLHSHLNPCNSPVSVKSKQTASPQRSPLQCSVVLSYLSLQGDGGGRGRDDALEAWVAASCRLSPHAMLHFPLLLWRRLTCVLTSIPTHPSKPLQNPRGGWTLLTETASATARVTGISSTRGNADFRCLTQSPAQRRRIFSTVSARFEPQ